MTKGKRLQPGSESYERPLFYFSSSVLLGRPCRSLPWLEYQDSRIVTEVIESGGH